MPGYARGALISVPHVARVGEGGQPELIGPVDFMAAALAGAWQSLGGRSGGGSARIVVENHVHLDGREVTRGIAPYLPAEVERYVPSRM